MHYITLHYITLHYIALHCIILHYITLNYITLYYIILHYITLYYIILHYIRACARASRGCCPSSRPNTSRARSCARCGAARRVLFFVIVIVDVVGSSRARCPSVSDATLTAGSWRPKLCNRLLCVLSACDVRAASPVLCLPVRPADVTLTSVCVCVGLCVRAMCARPAPCSACPCGQPT